MKTEDTTVKMHRNKHRLHVDTTVQMQWHIKDSRFKSKNALTQRQ